MKVAAGTALSAVLFNIPDGSGLCRVYAAATDDDGEKGADRSGELDILKRLGDYAGTEDLSDFVQNSGFTTTTTNTAYDPERDINNSTTDAPNKLTTGVDPTTGMKTVTQEVGIGESYHQDYDTYELSLNDRFFFYSNVGNGAITSNPVTLEMPANIFFTCEKDGVPYAAQSGKSITEKGTYVFSLTATETVADTIYIYMATYRFRIADKSARTGDDVTDPQQPYDIDEEPGLLDPVNTEPEEPELLSPADEEFDDAGLTEEEKAALSEILNEEEDDGEIGAVMNDDGSINRNAIEELTGQLDPGDIYTTEGINRRTGMASSYDYTSGLYKNTLRNSMSFYTDIPNGMITRREVTLRTTDDLSFTIYKDGQPFEFDPEQKISETGSYTIIPVAEDVLYYDAYQSETPIFSFRIIGSAVNDLSVYRAPEGFTISEIMVDGLPAEDVKRISSDAVLLREDGKYTITVTDGDRTIDTEFLLDRVRPRFYVSVEKNKASFAYKSTDVSETIIYKDGELISSGNIQNQVKSPGKYEVFAVDKAGNRGRSAFTVKYGFNKGAIAAIVLVVAAIAGLIGYMRVINSKVKVR